MSYRADIDGLRAIAIISVLVYHLDRAVLPGGFLGVDIFFVLSGFLLSNIIIKKMDERTFSMAEFYKRRVKRILPAFFVASITGVTLGFFLLLPDEFALSLRSLFYTTFFGQNYLFAFNAVDYWDGGAQKPLLHTWSLAVEEQFYALLPLALLLFWGLKLRSKTITALLIFLAFISFFSAHFWFEIPLLPDDFVRRFNYYSLTSRAGELLVGTLLALFMARRSFVLNLRLKNALATLSLVGIIACLIFFSETKIVFPGFWAVIPCVFVAVLIFANAPMEAKNGGGGGGTRLIVVIASEWCKPRTSRAQSIVLNQGDALESRTDSISGLSSGSLVSCGHSLTMTAAPKNRHRESFALVKGEAI